MQISPCILKTVKLVMQVFQDNNLTFMYLADAFMQSDLHCIQGLCISISCCILLESNITLVLLVQLEII